MEFLVGVFVGAVWYETLVLIALCVLFIGTAFAESAWSVAILAIWIGVLTYYNKLSISSIDWYSTALFVAVYLLIGVIWSGYKWFQYVKRKKEDHDKEKVNWYNRQSSDYKSKFSFEESVLQNQHNFVIPKSTDKVEEIAVWIVFWEISMISYMLYDMVIDLIKRLGGFYNKITLYAIK